MNFKESLQKVATKIKALWKTGKIQLASRITYDVAWSVILFFLITGFIAVFFIGGIGAGYFASLVKDEPLRSAEEMEKDIYNYEETSKLYFANDVYFGDVRSDLYREETTLENISPILTNAVIATEDEYFREHNGVVPKAILRALLQEVMNTSVQTGGSTLTQQLIKNQILTNEVSFERKAKEILLALRLEQFFDKDEILEAYLNIIPYGRDASGRNIAGIQTAAQGIFGINANEVNLAQAAYLAGLPQSPSAYTPFKNGGGLKDEAGVQPGLNRMKTVLNRMLDMNYITEDEYNEAINYDIVADFTGGVDSPNEIYPYLTTEIEKRAKSIIRNYLATEAGYTMEDLRKTDGLLEEYNTLADRALRMNGYQIHTTVNKEIYDKFQEVAKNFTQYGPDTVTTVKTEDGEAQIQQSVQASGVLIENSTGKIISFLGGRGFDEDNQINYMTRPRSNGSTMKPLLAYAPAMEKGIVQPGTPIADIPTSWGGYTPGNFDLRFHGILSARDNLTDSYNIPALKTYERVMNDNPVDQYLRKMGITTLADDEYANLSLAIGGTSKGVTLEENTNAYATFANNGQFVDAYMIDRITTVDGDVIYQHESKPVPVFSPQTSYLTLDMMRDVISEGSAAYLNSQLKYRNVDWAGKTGTSQNTENVQFVASNPNVTFGAWIGYKTPDSLVCESCDLHHTNRNIKLWAELVNAASDINPELMVPAENFARPDGIVEQSYCSISGMLPSDLCSRAGLVKTDLFNAKFVPTQRDDSLITGRQVIVNGKSVLAGAKTPAEFVQGDGLTFNPEFLKRNGYDRLSDLTQLFPAAERSKWEKIGIPSASIGSSVSDDGKAPGAPTSVTKSGSNLTWKIPGSKDVVGYRIYRAEKPGGKFTKIGQTTSTSYSIGNGAGVYHVKAVDYFGLESAASKEVAVGAPKVELPEKPEKAEEEKPEEEKTEEDSGEETAEETSEDTPPAEENAENSDTE
ncbi:penicillin-binding protein [Oceanobacillus zhaokaii]|uniref:Penicillin-binding protein n=1 Tax=Oceanobacillus zhaokaii TaxID=2052660 RepID=A0A345PI91_9BACI|nr:transglycosylase domain-containing protein [Oceanobacillus zhaokaii]AXI09721.1 penicillin-binding protein [Oceanobacillus zhaokaii]